jgi:hypothetical protein
MVENSGAKSTDMKNPEDVHNLSQKCKNASKKWAPVADKLWDISNSCVNCYNYDKKENKK